MSDQPWVREWWSQIVLGVGLLWSIFRVETRNRAHDALLFGDNGVPKVVLKADCQTCKENHEDEQEEMAESFTATIKELSARFDDFLKKASEDNSKLHARIDSLKDQIHEGFMNMQKEIISRLMVKDDR